MLAIHVLQWQLGRVDNHHIGFLAIACQQANILILYLFSHPELSSYIVTFTQQYKYSDLSSPYQVQSNLIDLEIKKFSSGQFCCLSKQV